jgi:metallo-beta-lactamase family protein
LSAISNTWTTWITGAFRAQHPYVETVENPLNRRQGAIILPAACASGRIRHHLRHRLWRPNTTVLLIGYQAPGTLGRLLEDGAPDVKILGEPISVKARIRRLEIYSGHADRGDLLDWVRARLPIARGVFPIHGEDAALEGMRQGVIGLGVPETKINVPELDQTYRLDLAQAQLIEGDARRLTVAKAAEAREGWDWHNELSAITLDLRHRLGLIEDDKQRMALLKDLRRVMGKSLK